MTEDDDEDKRQARVHLQPTTNIPEDSSSVLPLNRPFAVLLRLRVSQIVAGIVTVLLGAVACLEPSTRTTLGLGIPAGVLTVLAAIAHLQVARREYSATLLPTVPVWNTRTPPRPVDALRPWLPTLACVLTCLLLLALACMAATSEDSNRRTLGWLQTSVAGVVLAIETFIWTFRWHWITKLQIT